MKKTTIKQCLKIPELVTAGRFTHGPGQVFGRFYGGGEMSTKKEQTESDKVRAEMKSQLDQLKECNFEEFREGVIDFSKQMIDCQFRLLEEFGKLHAKLKKICCQH